MAALLSHRDDERAGHNGPDHAAASSSTCGVLGSISAGWPLLPLVNFRSMRASSRWADCRDSSCSNALAICSVMLARLVCSRPRPSCAALSSPVRASRTWSRR
jgi:hypothetical protein